MSYWGLIKLNKSKGYIRQINKINILHYIFTQLGRLKIENGYIYIYLVILESCEKLFKYFWIHSAKFSVYWRVKKYYSIIFVWFLLKSFQLNIYTYLWKYYYFSLKVNLRYINLK